MAPFVEAGKYFNPPPACCDASGISLVGSEASQLITDALSSGDPADAELPASKLRNRRPARGREQIASTFYSGGLEGYGRPNGAILLNILIQRGNIDTVI
jgi:hypothetical protein